MDAPTTTLGVLGAFVILMLTVVRWWIKNTDEKKQEKRDAEKSIKDAVDSGDVSRINSWVQRLRKN